MGQMNGRQMAAEHGAKRQAANHPAAPRPSSCLLLSLTGPWRVPCTAFMDGTGVDVLRGIGKSSGYPVHPVKGKPLENRPWFMHKPKPRPFLKRFYSQDQVRADM